MPDTQLVILTPAWRDIDRISDLHLMLVGPKSAEEITDKLLDTIALPPEKQIDKFKVLTVGPVFSEAIERIYEDKPVSIMFV